MADGVDPVTAGAAEETESRGDNGVNLWYGLAGCTEQDRVGNRLRVPGHMGLSLNLQLCPVVRLLTMRIEVPLACFFQNP